LKKILGEEPPKTFHDDLVGEFGVSNREISLGGEEGERDSIMEVSGVQEED
jgi:hypothetical protein